MENGDISNEVVPRLVIVYEGLLGLLPKKSESKFDIAVRFGRWKRAVDLFETNDLLARKIWDVTWRYNFSVDVVTFLGDKARAQIAARLENEDLPIRRVWETEPNNLSRQIAYMPDLGAIYFANEQLKYTFGSKGRFLSPGAANHFGTF